MSAPPDLVMHNEKGADDQTYEGLEYVDPYIKWWAVYLNKARRYDTDLADDWKGNADGILIFTGLFSATVAAFIVEGYKSLQPDSAADSAQLLGQISQQLAALSNGTHLPPPTIPQPSSFQPSIAAIRFNVCWFLSLTFSLSCALAATLMQRWARKYLRSTHYSHPNSQIRAQIRTYKFEGARRFGMLTAMETIVAVLHLSVLVFWIGLIQFLFTINDTVALVIMACVAVGGAAYVVLTALPFFFHDCPYSTPLQAPVTLLLRAISIIAKPIAAVLSPMCSCFCTFHRWLEFTTRVMESIEHRPLSEIVMSPTRKLNLQCAALGWTLRSLTDTDQFEAFLADVPQLLCSTNAGNDAKLIMTYLLRIRRLRLGRRITSLLYSCTTPDSATLADSVRQSRAVVCMRAMWYLMKYLDLTALTAPDYLVTQHLFTLFGERIGVILNAMKTDAASSVAVAARCTAALTVHAWRPISKGYDRALLETLVDVPDALHGWHQNSEDLLIIHVMGFIEGVLPHLPAVSDEVVSLVRDTLRDLLIGLNMAGVSPEIKTTFFGLYGELQQLVSNGASSSWQTTDGDGSRACSRPSDQSCGSDVMLSPYAALQEMLSPIYVALSTDDASVAAQATSSSPMPPTLSPPPRMPTNPPDLTDYLPYVYGAHPERSGELGV